MIHPIAQRKDVGQNHQFIPVDKPVLMYSNPSASVSKLNICRALLLAYGSPISI
jgi:hypothetical protein